MIDPGDRSDFFALIASVFAFYRRDFSDFAGNVWWEAMAPFDLAAVKDALNRHCVNPDVGQFMPMPADVVRMLQGSTQDSALVAWAKVDRTIRTVGHHKSVVFEDALIHRVITEMGGWTALGTKEEKEWTFFKNEFVTRYRGYRGRKEIPEYPPVLIGIYEAYNSKSGFAIAPPILIGDPKRATAVMLGGSYTPLLAMQQLSAQVSAGTLRLIDGRDAA
jgi:hypothetical protein